jgi:hypothetical protein
MSKKLTIILSLTLLGACVSTQPARLDGPFSITPATETALLDYFKKIHLTRRGAFAASMDGADSYYSYCPQANCMDPFHANIAQRKCESLSGKECRLLYIDTSPRMGARVDAGRGEPGKHGSSEGLPVDDKDKEFLLF